jgi:hypothetical protein
VHLSAHVALIRPLVVELSGHSGADRTVCKGVYVAPGEGELTALALSGLATRKNTNAPTRPAVVHQAEHDSILPSHSLASGGLLQRQFEQLRETRPLCICFDTYVAARGFCFSLAPPVSLPAGSR